jgi:predicted transcriptional regulator
MGWSAVPDRGRGRSVRRALAERVASYWRAGFWTGRVHVALVFDFLDRGRSVVSGSRGVAHHLPLGRFAVPDPDDGERMTYWRVEAANASGSKRVLRPWPADVRWAPMRPAYPEGLDREGRRRWADDWYADVYFRWKDDVIAEIAADPQAAADEFARSAPSADLPEPVKKRPRVRVRPRTVSRKQREISAQALLAEALCRAGLSERQIAGELGLPKTTVHRRLSGAEMVSGLEGVLLEVRIADLIAQVMELARAAGPEDVPRVLVALERVKTLQARAAGLAAVSCGEGPFGSLLGGGR